MPFKIHGSRTRSGDDLCQTCAHAHIHRGTKADQEVIYCQAIFEQAQRITYPVVECNEHKDANLPSLNDMTKIAWFINADGRPGKAGFVHGSKVTETVKEEVYDNNLFT